MATTLEKQALAASYASKGYLIVRDFFHKDDARLIREEAMMVFEKQFEYFKYNGTFLEKMKLLFSLQQEVFINCGKQVQHLMNLHRLSLNGRVAGMLHDLGLRWPNICTRPVLYFNHPDLAKEKVYHTVDAHQDWASMQGSSNAIVLWLPLVDMNKDIGTLQILEGSHRPGLRTTSVRKGFGMVTLTEEEEKKMRDVELNVGDALFFHSKLIHRSGKHNGGDIRWSAHFRYNDLEDLEFVQRGYVHPYVYHSVAGAL